MVSVASVKSTTELVSEAMSRGAIQIHEELNGLVNLLRTVKLRNIMEIGSEMGGTFWLWCQLTALGGIKISLDKPDGDSGSGRFVDPDRLTKRVELFESFSPGVKVITGDSHSPMIRQRVRAMLHGRELDFLFLDGDHSYEGVKSDFEEYREMVKRGGLIAFHDIQDSEFHRYRGCFVADFWNSLDGKKTEFLSGSTWGGIGVIEN